MVIQVELTTSEFDLLYYLAERAGEVISRRELFERVREIPYDGLDRSIDVTITRLRKKTRRRRKAAATDQIRARRRIPDGA